MRIDKGIRIWWSIIIFTFIETSLAYVCEKGVCAQAYGNLIIGRENRLSASSTCGLTNQTKFCVVTSLEGQKKCYWCSSQRKNERHHGIENVVAPAFANKKPWWQSQNGVENVSISLDLETKFYFSHLYLKFKTFRPAGMVIERSSDYGKTWQVYGYFARDCAKQFPGISVNEQKNFSVPYCTEKYSAVTPFENGEVIFRTLPPAIENTIDPFSEEVQNLVKFTNLRINFTKLHTLGDDLLDNRTDIKEKYYYAIYEMIIGGTCACFGHATRCLPLDGAETKLNMVHGKCECADNTKGLNCDECEDLYNDVKWAPAFGKKKNKCKKCNCNNHATSCHFDQKVFESTGQVSGGVCDDCQHLTTGRNCEQCKQFYYQDPNKQFTDPDVCLSCDCYTSGSVDDGICDSRTDPANGLVSGKCHCKENVDGRRCDACKNGFWNLTGSNPFGCIPCSCNTLGTQDNQGCNKETGECTCKNNVVGRDCNQCIPSYWSLSDSPDGCKPCNCDPGGSLDDRCDVITGQCRCRPYLTGLTCDAPLQSYFTRPLDFIITEAEVAPNCTGACSIELRTPYPENYPTTWTGPGLIRINPPATMYFPVQPVKVNLDFDAVIRYEPQSSDKFHTVQLTLIRPESPSGHCAGNIINNDVREVTLRPDAFHAVAHPSFCIEANKNYVIKLQFTHVDGNPNGPQASILIDSVLMIPHIESISFMNGSTRIAYDRQRDFYSHGCVDSIYSVTTVNYTDICKKYYYSIGAIIHGGAYLCECDATGSYSSICERVGGTCHCKPNVVGRKCNQCAYGTYGFGPEGCKACDCHSQGSLDNFCDVTSGQCKCRPQTYGRSCNLCQPGYWNYPNCQRCVCHGHADTCDQLTGACVECRNFTEGSHCDRCKEGFYGDPRIGVDIPCRRCPCPGSIESGHSFAQRCVLDPRSRDVICECSPGYAGGRCDSCSENHFGTPDILGGSCNACNCSNNIDITRSGNCDPRTGKCLKCLYDTDGFYCEHCRDGYYGDALHQTCRRCVCDLLGTDNKQGECDRVSGKCPCLPNVIGLSCDQCAPNHWKIASGSGCESCNCDPNGSESVKCNEFDGQCKCKSGFGGRRCDQCQSHFWGDPKQNKCLACDCDPDGSSSSQCNQTTGHCNCILGIGGDKCDRCARGFLGQQIPYCNPCGECFDNWDAILRELKVQTKSIMDNTTQIMKTGASGSYVNEFEAMETNLAHVRQVLQNISASSQHLQDLEKKVEDVRSGILFPENMNDIRNQAENVTQRITLASLALEEVRLKTANLNTTARNLKENATKLQEGNVEGALNLTREAHERARKLKEQNVFSGRKAAETQQNCKRTEGVIGRIGSQFQRDVDGNNAILQKLNEFLNKIEVQIPSLNQQLCDKGGNPCDQLCGGAGCGSCGGLSCDQGALTKAESALKFAKDADKEIKEKEIKVGELFRGISQTRDDAKDAQNTSMTAHRTAETVKDEFVLTLNHTNEMIKQLEEFTNNSASTPAQIREKAEQTIQKTIQLQPAEILDLARKINDTVSSLSNVDAIIRDTQSDVGEAKQIKFGAESIFVKANHVLNVTETVLAVLDQAEQSQKLAESAIETANSNISLAKNSLSQISQTNREVRNNIDETVKKFSDVEEQFKTLQTEYLENNANAQKVEEELTRVTNDINDTSKKTNELTVNYKQASVVLDEKSAYSSSAFENSQKLAERASKLLLNATEKIKELSSYEKQFEDQEKNLKEIDDKMKALTNKVEIILKDISDKSEYYQTCTL